MAAEAQATPGKDTVMMAAARLSQSDVRKMIEREIALFAAGVDASAFDTATLRSQALWRERTLADFRAALVPPHLEAVHFAGGFQEECWAVTRSNGDYHVVYMPIPDRFSLVRETAIGPVDMSIHGGAIAVFSTT